MNSVIKIYKENFPDRLRLPSKVFKNNLEKYSHVNLLNIEDTIKGFSLLNYYNKYKLLHLDYIALDKQYQGNGNGTKYLKSIINKYNSPRIKYFILECEDHLIKFYQKNGFDRIKYNYKYFNYRLNLMIYSSDHYKPSELIRVAGFMSQLFSLIIDEPKKYIMPKNVVDFINSLLINNKYKYHVYDNFI